MAPIDKRAILLVDDSPQVRSLVKEILKTLDWAILEAGDAIEAIQVAAGYDGIVNLLVTDLHMPGMNGLELAAELRKSHSDMKVLCMSGDRLPKAGPNDIHFIEKPFRPDILVQRVRQFF